MDTVCESGLSALDLKALKSADRVAFFLYNGQSSIVGTKDVKNAGPYDDRDKRYTILTDTEMRDYDDKGHNRLLAGYRCFALVHGDQYDECWRTTVESLRVGDTLKLVWLSDGNQNTAKAGLHLDILRLSIKRENGKKLAFHVKNAICPDNTARMIRYTG